jgi:hypothetical protein
MLATIHVRTGERDGLQMAHHAITATTKLNSGRVRKQLLPLVDALKAQRGSDAKELRPVRDCARKKWPLTGQRWPPM